MSEPETRKAKRVAAEGNRKEARVQQVGLQGDFKGRNERTGAVPSITMATWSFVSGVVQRRKRHEGLR
jgi:hypothetical protein